MDVIQYYKIVRQMSYDMRDTVRLSSYINKGNTLCQTNVICENDVKKCLERCEIGVKEV